MPLGRGNLFWARRGSLVLLVQSTVDPTVTEWDGFLTAASETMAENGGRCRVLVFTAGGKPDAEQRARSLESGWRDNKASPVVVVTSDTLARGVITVFSWFGLNIRAFTEAQLQQAYDRLQLTPLERRWLSVERRILEERLKL
ncbi:MAG: STAS/SEC14 domain-containing protein [Myxococcales bacterium]|nr:MAG: STAS/SEC14 domain-containing protein [Myxococcales bacterium]